MSKENNPCRHPVMRIPGVIFESVYIDTLHVLDLGVSLHCAANLFVDIVHELPGSRQSNLVTLRQDVMSLYEEFRTPADCRGPTLELKHSAKYNLLPRAPWMESKGSEVLGSCVQGVGEQCPTISTRFAMPWMRAGGACLSHYSWLAKHAAQKRRSIVSSTTSVHICLIWQRVCFPGFPGLVSRWWVRLQAKPIMAINRY